MHGSGFERLHRSVRFLPLLFCGILVAAEAPFLEHVLATDLKGGYQVVAADLNRDGRPDLIALASGMTDLVWFENPGPNGNQWRRHILARDLPRMINCAVWDFDRDGIPEIGLAYEFANEASRSIGIVAVLRHKGDPRGPWTVTEIDRLTTSHRLRWADVDGTGNKVLVNAPLTGANAKAPEYRDRVPLVFYRPGAWKRELISDSNEGVQHGIFVTDWDKRERDAILTASFSGLHLYRFNKREWQRTELAKGNSGPWPKSGSSDVAVGYLRKQRYLAAIEPWHGNEVVVYSNGKRSVLDDSLVDGHTIITADVDRDGKDEVIAGYRGKGRSVYVYTHRSDGWTKSPLDDGGIAAAACASADLNGDGRIDIACIGSATTNLKWYENQTSR
jgi:hypothetical protein